MKVPAQVHPTAIDGALIGEGTHLWHWVHICGAARIGKTCSLGQNVCVGNTVLIGNDVRIQKNVSIYDPITLKYDVFCGPSMVFTSVYNPRSAVNCKDEYRRTLVMRGAILGANCTIVCGTTIGKYVFIDAGAVVNRGVKRYALIIGVPARQVGWMSEYGERLSLPVDGEGSAVCPHTEKAYRLVASNLSSEEK